MAERFGCWKEGRKRAGELVNASERCAGTGYWQALAITKKKSRTVCCRQEDCFRVARLLAPSCGPNQRLGDDHFEWIRPNTGAFMGTYRLRRDRRVTSAARMLWAKVAFG